MPGRLQPQDELNSANDAYLHGEEYGDGVPWAEEGQGSFYYLLDGAVPASIMDRPLNSRVTVWVKVRVGVK